MNVESDVMIQEVRGGRQGGGGGGGSSAVRLCVRVPSCSAAILFCGGEPKSSRE